MRPVSTTNIKSMHVGKIEFLVRTPLGAWGHKIGETEGQSVISVGAHLTLRTDNGHLFNDELFTTADQGVLDAAEKLSSLIESHIAEILGSAPAVTNKIPEGIGSRGI